MKLEKYQYHPELVKEIQDEKEKEYYKRYIKDKSERLKWLSSVTSSHSSVFMSLVFVFLIAIFIWEIIYNKKFDFSGSHPWLWGSVSPNSFLDCGAKYSPLIVSGDYWRLLTAMFVHVSFLHLLVNIISLLMFFMILLNF